jgi:hypothetical protein
MVIQYAVAVAWSEGKLKKRESDMEEGKMRSG